MAQTHDLKTAIGYPKLVQQMVTGWLERAAEKMPEEEFTSPGLYSVGMVVPAGRSRLTTYPAFDRGFTDPFLADSHGAVKTSRVKEGWP